MDFKNTIKIGMSLLVMFLFTNSYAQSKERAIGELAFEKEVIDFGTINQNDNGLRVFKFTNTGNAPVVISKVKTSCGCTLASKPEKAVLPGETAQIEVNYDTKKLGKFSKGVTVISNAKRSNLVLTIKGEVKKKSS